VSYSATIIAVCLFTLGVELAYAQISSCPLPNYPDATCTGVPAGTQLTTINGDINITTANTVVDSKDIHGCVSVNAPGVVIKNSKITCSTDMYAVHTYQVAAPWLTIQDSEISCGDKLSSIAVGEEQVTVLRSNIHSCENGFEINKNFHIEDSYIHDLYQGDGIDAPHTDGIQMWNIAQDVLVKHNRIYSFTNGVNGTSAMISPPVEGRPVQAIIRDNLLAGGAFALYCPRGDEGGSHPEGYNFQVINNHFSTINGPRVGEYGPTSDCENETVFSGNVIHETGKTVNPDGTFSTEGTVPPPAPTLTFAATPTSIASGQKSVLLWNATNAYTCTASNRWTGSTDAHGILAVHPKVTTIYSLNCTGPSGTVSGSVTVTVGGSPSLTPTPTPTPKQ
jgi:hypothetical protein